MNEVHRLITIPENHRSLAGFQTLHPANKHLRIPAVDVHARAVSVEITKGDIVKRVTIVEGSEKTFVKGLRYTIEGPVAIWVMRLCCRELIRKTVDGCRRRGDDLFDTLLDAQLEQIEGRLYHNFHCEARLCGAVGNPQCCKVKDNIGRLYQIAHQSAITNIALDHPDPTDR